MLSDYVSDKLNLADPGVYRDLSKPVGALNPDRLARFIERYREIEEDGTMPPFFYGSHYSSIATALYFLVRVEPFTTHFLHFNGGSFDHADRAFGSLAETWQNALSSSSDVKELIPEMYYLPEAFINANGFDLGTRQVHTVCACVLVVLWWLSGVVIGVG